MFGDSVPPPARGKRCHARSGSANSKTYEPNWDPPSPWVTPDNVADTDEDRSTVGAMLSILTNIVATITADDLRRAARAEITTLQVMIGDQAEATVSNSTTASDLRRTNIAGFHRFALRHPPSAVAPTEHDVLQVLRVARDGAPGMQFTGTQSDSTLRQRQMQ